MCRDVVRIEETSGRLPRYILCKRETKNKIMTRARHGIEEDLLFLIRKD